MIAYPLLLFSLVAVLSLVTNVKAANSWEGNLTTTHYGGANCSLLGSGFIYGQTSASSLKSIGNGELCETDHLIMEPSLPIQS